MKSTVLVPKTSHGRKSCAAIRDFIALPVTSTARWALGYAERLSWRVLPCWPGTKRAIYPHSAASNDPEQVGAWVEEHGDNLGWAVATGPSSGIIVVDVENAEGERELATLEQKHGALPDFYPMVWSGGGAGWHGYFAWPGCEIRNRQLGGSLEIRGDRLLCMLPPSRHPSGKRYSWARDRSPGDVDPPQLPEPWIEFLKPEPAPERPAVRRSAQPGNPYAMKAFENELAMLVQAPIRTRNNTLNKVAHSLFRFVADGELPHDAIAAALFDAA